MSAVLGWTVLGLRVWLRKFTLPRCQGGLISSVLLILSSWLGPVPGLSAQASDPFDTATLPRIDADLLVRVGGHDTRTDYLFSTVRGAVVLDSATVAVLDRGSKEVRAYGLDGVLLWKVGGEGEGPGEFRFPTWMGGLRDGHFMVWDPDLHRATVFDQAQRVVRSDVHEVGVMSRVRSRFVGAFTDASWVRQVEVHPMNLRDVPAGLRRDSIQFVRMRPAGEIARDLLVSEGPERWLVRFTPTSWVRERPIFGHDLLAGVQGDTLLLLRTDSLVLDRVTREGQRLSSLRLRRPIRPVTRRMVEQHRAQLVAKAEASARSAVDQPMGIGQASAARAAALRSLPAAESLPAVADLLVAADGGVWLREFEADGHHELWFSLDRTFNPSGWLALPPGERLVAVGHGRLVSVFQDDLDVETLVVRALR